MEADFNTMAVPANHLTVGASRLENVTGLCSKKLRVMVESTNGRLACLANQFACLLNNVLNHRIHY